MMRHRKALFIGRFQPLHLGHLDAIENIFKEGFELVVVIGSIQEYQTERNPFSFQERKEMLELVFDQTKMKVCIRGVKDYKSDEDWAKDIENQVGIVDIVVSGNEHVLKIFDQRGVDIRKVAFNIDISATKIRDMIHEGNQEWKTFVPEILVAKIEKKLG